MALESVFDNIWTAKSDVWSFGIVLWEIFTLGAFPYPGLTALETTEKIRIGYRMDKPARCPDQISEVMSDCWSADPNDRPAFDKVKLRLETFRESIGSYISLGMENDDSSSGMENDDAPSGMENDDALSGTENDDTPGGNENNDAPSLEIEE